MYQSVVSVAAMLAWNRTLCPKVGITSEATRSQAYVVLTWFGLKVAATA
jgi:hypothetical protein